MINYLVQKEYQGMVDAYEKAGGDDIPKPGYEYQKQILDLPPQEKQPSYTYELRKRQQTEIEANKVAAQLRRQKEDEAARRVDAILSKEKTDAERAEKHRVARLKNLELAKMAKEESAKRQEEINKVRRKNLKKARRKLKRQRKKK